MIARATDSIGQIVPPNRVVYPNAFAEIEADVMMIYTASGLEQDVIFRADPGPPSDYGLPDRAQLTVVTEFQQAPEPTVKRVAVPGRDGNTSPELGSDTSLGFGGMRMVRGVAFERGANGGPTSDETVPIGKSWRTDNGRKLLLELVSYEALQGSFDRLADRSPAAVAPARPLAQTDAVPVRSPATGSDQPMAVDTNANLVQGGVVMDYVIHSQSLDNLTLRSGETYIINDLITITNSLVIEGGTVVKFQPSTVQQYLGLDAEGSVECKTTPYSPAIFTARDDDTVGEKIEGLDPGFNSDGNPDGDVFGKAMLKLSGISNAEIQHLSFKYANFGLWFSFSPNGRVTHTRFTSCDSSIIAGDSSGLYLGNVLITDPALNPEHSAIRGWRANEIRAEHLTIENIDYLFHNQTLSSIELRNSMIVDCPNLDYGNGFLTETFNLGTVEIDTTVDGDPFESTLDGHFYLPGSSSHRDTGIAAIDPRLKYELERRTTSPPITTYDHPAKWDGQTMHWTPYVERDDDGALDLGYHYPPIDYLVYWIELLNSELTVDAGTAIGLIGSIGMFIDENSEVSFNGTVTAPIEVAWYGDLQDATNPSRVSPYSHSFMRGFDIPNGTTSSAHFDWVRIHNGSYHTGQKYFNFIRATDTYGITDLQVTNCRIDGHVVYLNGSSGQAAVYRNNHLVEGRLWGHYDTNVGVEFFNNRVERTTIDLDQGTGSDQWLIYDNIFESLGLSSAQALVNAQYDHNAYYDTAFRLGGSNQIDDVSLTALSYVQGPFGDCYVSSSTPSLINEGSQSAADAGLYHYATTWPDDTKEGATTVNIGLHYPSTIPGSGGN